MKTIVKIIIVLILSTSFFSINVNADIAYFVDFRKVLNESAAGKKAQDYLKKQIILNLVKVESTNKIYYKNIFEAEKIKIKYNFKSLFSDMIVIDHLIFYNSKIYLDIDINNEIIFKDNFKEIEKQEKGYKPKIYPIKKKDINFLILKFQTYNTQGFIKSSNKSNEIKTKLSNMNFNKIGNKTGFQHYKGVFKIILRDFFLRIPDTNLQNLIKKTYKF